VSHPAVRRGGLRRRAAGALGTVVVVALTACSSGANEAADAPERGLTVLAAASLQSAFTELGERFEAANPGTTVRLSFAGSADLAAQVQQGAPADVVATADEATMARLADDGLLAGPARPFAGNTMMIAVPAGNPAGITAFDDLGRAGVAVVVCAPQVPCGAAAQRIQASTGVTLAPVSEEGSVAGVLGKVGTGQADAGVVYRTDVAAAGPAVQGIAIPEAVNATTTYPIAVLADSAEPALARAFADLVLGEAGQQVLRDAGFTAP
jgi:molybdate transport system substrate-binding protein